MLTKIAALALVFSTAAASAGGFARPPHATPVPITEALERPPVAELPSRAAVKAALAKRRAHNLAAFHAYWSAGVYPHNTYRVGPLNVWRDDSGHFCAAATMIDKDGQHELAEKTGNANPYIRLLDTTEGPLLDWMMTSGLTIEEIDRIQAPMIEPPMVDAQTLAAEDAKLKKGYIATEAFLKKHANEDLELATTRLMHYPALASALVQA
jgi:hypothetical protein